MKRLATLAVLLCCAVWAQDGVIAGSVPDAASHVPLPGVRVSIDTEGFEASAVSDGAGGFRFDHLSPTSYYVRARMTGYLGSEAQGAFYRVDLRTRATRDDLRIELTPKASVEGTVFDEDGKPMANVGIYTQSSLQATTDQNGHFEMTDLAPLTYRIDLRIPMEVRKQTLKRDPETAQTFGYPNTEYYPGTPDPQAAVSVPIAPGLHLRGFDIRLRRARLVDLSGRVVERADDNALAGARVELAPNLNTLADESFAAREVDSQGGFRFELIPPGSYALMVYRGGSSQTLPYLEALEVGKAGVADLAVRLPMFQNLEGRVVTAKDGVEWLGHVTLNLMPMQRGAPPRTFTLTAPNFTLEQLPPGRYRFAVNSKVTEKGSGQVLVANAVHLGTQDLIKGAAFIVEGGNPPLEIRLSAETGTLKIRVAEPDGAPRVRMVFLSRQPKEGAGAARILPIGADGSVTVEDLVPGMYEVVLAEEGPVTDIAISRRAGTPVEVRTGEVSELILRIPGR